MILLIIYFYNIRGWSTLNKGMYFIPFPPEEGYICVPKGGLINCTTV